MKKTISSLALLLVTTFTAMAQNVPLQLLAPTGPAQVVLTSTDSNPAEEAPILWSYSKNSAVGGVGNLAAEATAGMAIQVPAGAYAGDTIKYIRFALKQEMSEVKYFIRRSLNGEDIRNGFVGDIDPVVTGEWNECKLDEPLVLTEDDGWLYIGYTGTMAARKYSLGYFNVKVNRSRSNYVNVAGNWTDQSDNLPPAAIEARLAGPNEQKYSIQIIGNSTVSSVQGSETIVPLTVFNTGQRAANIVNFEYTFNGATATKKNVVLAIHSFDQEVYELKLPAINEAGDYPLSVKVTKIDSKDNENTAVYNCVVRVMDQSFKKVVVCEEYTGNTCGYCPQGIIALEDMRKKYPDTFLPIACHLYHTSDPMYCGDTYNQIRQYFDGAPNSIFDRNPNHVGNPLTLCEGVYNRLVELSPAASVVVNFTKLDDLASMVKLSATVRFATSQSGLNYKIAFVVLEDRVDKDQFGNKIYQTNNYAGTGQMGEWSDLPKRTPWVYDDVARGIYNYNGIDNSVPETVVEMTDYTFDYTLTMPYVLNFANVRFAALLIDGKTGRIENAGFVAVTPSAGVEMPSTDTSFSTAHAVADGIRVVVANEEPTDIEVYSIDGRRVASMAKVCGQATLPVAGNGIYVVRCLQGRNTTDIKVIK